MSGWSPAHAMAEPQVVHTAPSASMVARLTLTDFRNYERLRLDVLPGPIVLTGPNGAGKTNLLEAVSLLAPGRGLRGARLAEIVRRHPGENPEQPDRAWAVAARLESPHGITDIGTGLDGQSEGRERRVVHVNGDVVRTQAVLSDHAAINWLTPAMDRLFLEGSSQRRRFLDRLVFVLDPAHAGRVSSYEHAQRERARLLREGSTDGAWFDALEDTMATRGVAVAEARRSLTADLDAVAAHAPGPFPRARLKVLGDVEDWLGEGPALEAEDRLRAVLRADRKRDAENGTTAHGPHRSDLAVVHVDKGMAADMCSTGEQKALLIAIVLANARLQARLKRAAPILLLDEVVAHLDAPRRSALFETLVALGTQAWLTGTDREVFAPLQGAAQFFSAAAGTMTSVR